jgi:hypothetical protein
VSHDLIINVRNNITDVSHDLNHETHL